MKHGFEGPTPGNNPLSALGAATGALPGRLGERATEEDVAQDWFLPVLSRPLAPGGALQSGVQSGQERFKAIVYAAGLATALSLVGSVGTMAGLSGVLHGLAPVVGGLNARRWELAHWREKTTAIVEDLHALYEEEREAEQPVTDFALETALSVLRAAYGELDKPVPMPASSPDGEGGIFIEWLRPQRNVRLVIPGQLNQRAYIYHRVGDFSDISRLSGARLAQLLDTIILTA
jgi:hypothetical protein